MGSLMAGWSSHVLADDHHKVRLMRNRSLTKEEVEAFWRRRRRPSGTAAELVAGEIITDPQPPPPPAQQQQQLPVEFPRVRSLPPPQQLPVFPRVRSLPPPPTSSTGSEPAALGDGGSPSASRDWWTRSSWAFLNEAPPPPPPPGG